MKNVKTKHIIYIIVLIIIMVPMTMAEKNLTENTTIEKFKVEPVVALKPINDLINSSTDIFLVLYMANPPNNDVDLNVDMNIKNAPGIRAYGQGLSTNNIGNLNGMFNVAPGKTKIIGVTLKAEKVGDFVNHFDVRYWPGNNKNNYRSIALNFKFRAEDVSSNPEGSGQLNKEGTIPSVIPSTTVTPKKAPDFSIVLVILVFVVLYINRK